MLKDQFTHLSIVWWLWDNAQSISCGFQHLLNSYLPAIQCKTHLNCQLLKGLYFRLWWMRGINCIAFLECANKYQTKPWEWGSLLYGVINTRMLWRYLWQWVLFCSYWIVLRADDIKNKCALLLFLLLIWVVFNYSFTWLRHVTRPPPQIDIWEVCFYKMASHCAGCARQSLYLVFFSRIYMVQ